MQYNAVLTRQKLTASQQTRVKLLNRKQTVHLAFGVLQNTPAVAGKDKNR